MKKTFGLLFATMMATAVLARVPIDPVGTPATNPPPIPTAPAPTPAPAQDTTIATPPPLPPESTSTNKPATKVKKTVKKKKAAAKKTAEAKAKDTNAAPTMAAEPLVPNEPAVAKQNHVNVRGQAHINSELVGHLQKGDAVTVLEVITLKHPKTDEPAKWAKIALPSSMHVWVNTPFIDASNQVVSARKLNLRTGPGENYSVIGLLHKGDAIKTVTSKGEWTQIEAPTNSFAFVAAHLLTGKAAETVTPPPVTPTTTLVENPVPVAAPPTTAPTTGATTPPVAPPPVIAPPIPAPLPPPADEPLPKRVVEREGIVGGTVSIQAPSHFELKNLYDGKVMDYLYTTSTNVDLRHWKGKTIIVKGEEELDERWPNTPVLTIQRIQVVE